MPRLSRPTTLTLQTGHSLYTGLVGLWYNDGTGNMVDALSALNLPAVGTAGTATGSYGAVGRCDAADEGFNAAAAAGNKLNGDVTICWYGVPTGTPTDARAPIFGIARTAAGGGTKFSLCFTREGFAPDNILLQFSDGVGQYGASGGGWNWSSLYNTDVTLIGEHDDAGAQDFLVNNTSRGSNSVGGNLGYGADAVLGFGVLTTADAGTNPKIDNILGMQLSRKMTPSEKAEWDNDPWVLLRNPSPPDPPTIVSATVNTTGDEITVVYSDSVTVTVDFAGSLSGTAATGLTLGTISSGDGTNTHVYPIVGGIVHIVTFDATVLLNMDAGSVEATNIAGSTGNDAVVDQAVTNNSDEFYTPRDTHMTYKITSFGQDSNTDTGIIGQVGSGEGSGRSGFGTRYRDRFLSR